MSWASWLLFTGVPARCVVLRVRCPGPLGSCSPVRPFCPLLCSCGVLGHLAPVHRCARSVCYFACAVSWATWLLFTSVPPRCVVLRVRCPGPLGSCSLVRPPRPLLCLCGVLRHLAPVYWCARSVCWFACAVSWATWLLFTGVPAVCVPFVRGVLGHLAPVHRCARSVGCVARAVSWAPWLPFTGVPARWVVLRVRCPGPLGSCSPVCSFYVLCFGLRVRCCVCGASLRGAHSSIRTAAGRNWQGLGTLRARTRPSGRRLFVAGRGWVPSGRALVHPDGGWCCSAPVPVPWFSACCALSPGFRHPAAVVAWHLSVCLGCGRRRASLACLVAPRGAPRLVRSGRSRCSGRLSRRCGAFPIPGGLRFRLYWVAARGTRRPAENRAHCACRWPRPRQGRWAPSASYPFGAPRWGSPWRVPPALVFGCVRCGGWRVWTRSLTRPVSHTVRRSTGDSAGAPGLFRVDADTSPCGSEDDTPGSRVLVRVLVRDGPVAWAGLLAAFWCASPFPLATVSFCFARAPPGWGCPFLCPFFFLLLLFSARPCCLLRSLVSGPGCLRPWRLFLSSPPPPAGLCCFAPFFSSFLLRPRCPWLSLVSGPGCAGPWRCVLFVLLASPFSALLAPSPRFCLLPGRWLLPGGCRPLLPPPSPFVSRGFRHRRSVPCFLFFFFFFLPFTSCAPVVSALLWFPAPGALGLGACVVCSLGLSLLSSPCALASFVSPARPLAAVWWLPPPPPPPPSPSVSRGFRRRCSVPCFFFLPFPFCAPVVSGFLWFPAPECRRPWGCVLFVLLASRL